MKGMYLQILRDIISKTFQLLTHKNYMGRRNSPKKCKTCLYTTAIAGEQPRIYKCGLCDMLFNTEEELTDHVKGVHTSTPRFRLTFHHYYRHIGIPTTIYL